MQKHIFRWLSAIALLTGLASCHSGQKTVATASAEQIAPTENSILWRISGNGLKKPSYLYGTIHLIPKDQLQFSDATLSALQRSERIAFEIDMKDMTNLRTQLSLMTKAFMKNGQTLRNLLPAEDYQFVREKMDEKGMSMGMFERLKPMFLSMMLGTDENETGAAGLGDKDSPMTSVEMELYKLAKKQKIKSAGLETADYQMSVFDSIPYTAQAKMLVETLRNADSNPGEGSELDRMLTLYREQNIEAMQQTIATDSTGMGDYEDLLLSRRNRNWIPKMGQMMLLQPTFFAVGAGHLGGPGGVVALLRKAGYRVEPLK